MFVRWLVCLFVCLFFCLFLIFATPQGSAAALTHTALFWGVPTPQTLLVGGLSDDPQNVGRDFRTPGGPEALGVGPGSPPGTRPGAPGSQEAPPRLGRTQTPLGHSRIAASMVWCLEGCPA